MIQWRGEEAQKALYCLMKFLLEALHGWATSTVQGLYKSVQVALPGPVLQAASWLWVPSSATQFCWVWRWRDGINQCPVPLTTRLPAPDLKAASCTTKLILHKICPWCTSGRAEQGSVFPFTHCSRTGVWNVNAVKAGLIFMLISWGSKLSLRGSILWPFWAVDYC